MSGRGGDGAMAIRFVDVQPEEAAKPAGVRRARPPEAAPDRASQPGPTEDAPAPIGDRVVPAGGDALVSGLPVLPGLPHAKPEPKPRGRKKPMSAVSADKRADKQPDRESDRARAPDATSAPLLEGLLPELQAHAKPIPKPRGRRKAFG